jgi:MFS family permease
MLLHLAAFDVGVLVAARGVLGAGEAFFLVAALAAASDLAPPERRGEALSFLSLSLYLGVAIGPLIGETVLGAGAYDQVWLVTVGFAAVAVVLSVLVPETAPAVVAGGPRARPPLIHPAGLFPGLIVLTGMWGMAGFFTFLPSHARSVGLSGASLPLVVYALTVIVLRIFGARIPDRFGSARVASIALALSATGLALMGLLPTLGGLLVGTFVFAAGIAFIMPAIVSLAVSLVPPEERGTVVGTTAVFLDVAFGVAPVVLGLVAVGSGAGPTFLLSAAVAAFGSAMLIARGGSLRSSGEAKA